MVDITKEEFWDNNEEILKKEENKSKVREFITRHKVITVLLLGLSILMTVNTILVYNFFKILTSVYNVIKGEVNEHSK